MQNPVEKPLLDSLQDDSENVGRRHYENDNVSWKINFSGEFSESSHFKSNISEPSETRTPAKISIDISAMSITNTSITDLCNVKFRICK
jgi:hypothetical protein